MTDALSHVTTYANGPSSTNTYDLFGNPLSVSDPNGVVTTMSFDPRGRLTSRTIKGVPGDPLDLTTGYQYDPAGKLTRVTLPLGNGTAYGFDPSNRLTDTTRLDASGLEHERLHLTYDVMSQKTREDSQACTTPAAPCTTWTTSRYDTFGYDGYGRLQTITHPDSTFIQSGYDAFGDLTSVQDERHTTPNTLYTYDFGHRLTQVQQTLGAGSAFTSYAYNLHGDLASVVDPNLNVTSYSWDNWGRMTCQSSPVSGTTTYAYDAAGNLLASTDGNSATTTRTYDALNRVTSAISSRSGLSTEQVTTSYDDATPGHFGIGRLTGMSDPSGSTSLAYDRRGLLASRVQTIGTTPYTLGFVYDANGNRTTMTYPSSRIVTYGFDFADRPVSANAGGTSYVAAAGYAPFGPLSTLNYGTVPPMIKTMAYDQRYLPQSLVVTGASEPVSYTYTPDGAGNLLSITDTSNTNFSRTFAYDDLNRLTTANSGGSLWGAGNHAYDPMGNLQSMQLGTTTRSFTYSGQTPKISSVTENGTPRNVNYDLAGNESVQGATYTYSPRNLLAEVSGVTGAIIRGRIGTMSVRRATIDPDTVYTYDGRGLRVKLSQSTGGTAQERSFIYDDQLHLVAETTYQVPPSTGIQYEYIWFGGQPVAQETIGGSTSWTITDHLGTPFLQANVSGTVIWRVEYEPYGEVYSLRSGTDRHQPLRLPGQEAEQLDLGLNGGSERSYNIFRWYRPKWGRYTQADPVGLGETLDLYSYVDGKPTALADPTGLFSTKACGSRWITFFGGVNHVPIVGGALDKLAGNNLLGFCATCPGAKDSPQAAHLAPAPPVSGGVPDLTLLPPGSNVPGGDSVARQCGSCTAPNQQLYLANVKTRLALTPGALDKQRQAYSLEFDCKCRN